MDCGELKESVPEPKDFLEEFELQLFFDDWPDMKPNPFLFLKLPWDFIFPVSFSTLKAS